MIILNSRRIVNHFIIKKMMEITSKQSRVGFSSLPLEVHRLIFDILKDDIFGNSSKWRKYDWSTNNGSIRDKALNLCLIDRTWRSMVQSLLLSEISVSGMRLGLPEATEFFHKSPDAVYHLRQLTIKHPAGNTKIEPPDGPLQRLGRKPFFIGFNNHPEWEYPANERGQIFLTVWNDLAKLLNYPRQGSGRVRLILNLLNPSLDCDARRQFCFVPRDADRVQELDRLHGIEELRLSTRILEHLELHPQYIRNVISALPDLNTFTMKISLLRPLRSFRQDIQKGKSYSYAFEREGFPEGERERVLVLEN